MKAAEFEEKEYEGPLYNQLERGNRLLWPPGQVLEEYLGFDRAFMLEDPYLWQLHGIRRPYRGLSPYFFRWPFLPPERRHRNRLPRFRVNCFIQAKRSEFGKRLSKRLASLGERRPFFRFGIESDQQTTLEAAASRLRGKALFVYAAPVFYRSQELFAHMAAGTVVQQSTFPEVTALAGHGAWYYNEPGAHGVRNPDFESVRLPVLDEQLARLAEQQRGQTEGELSPSQDLADLRRQIQMVVAEEERPTIGPREAYLAEEWRRIDSFAEETGAPPALASYLAVEAFALHFNLLWLTIA